MTICWTFDTANMGWVSFSMSTFTTIGKQFLISPVTVSMLLGYPVGTCCFNGMGVKETGCRSLSGFFSFHRFIKCHILDILVLITEPSSICVSGSQRPLLNTSCIIASVLFTSSLQLLHLIMNLTLQTCPKSSDSRDPAA